MKKSQAFEEYSEKELQSYAISYEDFVPRTDRRENLRGTDDRPMTRVKIPVAERAQAGKLSPLRVS